MDSNVKLMLIKDSYFHNKEIEVCLITLNKLKSIWEVSIHNI